MYNDCRPVFVNLNQHRSAKGFEGSTGGTTHCPFPFAFFALCFMSFSCPDPKALTVEDRDERRVLSCYGVHELALTLVLSLLFPVDGMEACQRPSRAHVLRRLDGHDTRATGAVLALVEWSVVQQRLECSSSCATRSFTPLVLRGQRH